MLTIFLRKMADFAWRHNLEKPLFFLRKFKEKTDAEGATISVGVIEEKLKSMKDVMKKKKSIKILEIGPYKGAHSIFIDRFFKPSKLIFVERDIVVDLVSKWIDKITCEHEIVYSDFLLAQELEKKGKFDIIFCLGFIYHNVEYFKTLNFIRRLIKDDGYLVLGTVLSYKKDCSININYRKGQLFDFTRPTRNAIETILEMTGFNKIQSLNLPYPNQRGFFIYKAGEKPVLRPGQVDFGGSRV